jgi:imidazolonepropionase-like amidohydrolase
VRPLALLALALTASAQTAYTPGRKPFLATEATNIVLRHVRVNRRLQRPPREDQTLVIANGKISSAAPPPDAHVFDLPGHTVIPGLVGMHEHLFYPAASPIYAEQAFSFPRLYLAAGVTTARTAGSLEPYTDLSVKRLIDDAKMPGPKFRITGPYLEGRRAFTPQMHELDGPEDAVRTVEYWASEGVTSFKYMNITRAELKAAIDAAHKRMLKVTR